MSNLQAFFAQNADQPQGIERVISKRFKDSEGNPIKFKFKAISTKRDAELKDECTKKTIITQGKMKGQTEKTLDAMKYQILLTIESMEYPNLHDATLQDSYKVNGAEDLFNKMFTPGEFMDAYLAAQDANGYEVDLEELVEQAKN